MILVRFYTEDERIQIENGGKGFLLGTGDSDQAGREPEVLDWQSVFSAACNDSGEPPFRDSMSVALLEGLGITFVDGDWYSVMWKGERMPLSGMEEGIRFALSAVICSRRGKYMWFSQLGYEFLDKLARLPGDILFAVCRSGMEDVDCITSGSYGCRFVNFPYQGSTIEVACRPFHMFDGDHYQGVPYGNGGKYYLYKGDDGVYYCGEDVSDILQYRWWEDIDNVIKYIDSRNKARVYLARPSQEYSLLELGEMLAGDENAIAQTEYLGRVQKLEQDFHIGRITKGEYESVIKALRGSSLYDKYLYFRDTFKVVCHMAFIPEELEENLVIISVNKYPDGTYHLTGDKTYFKPKVCDAVSSMFFNAGRDYAERVSLVVRPESDNLRCSYIGSVRSIADRAVFGFKAMKDCVEIFDTYEAVQAFGAALKEAQDSGNCTGYKWVVRVVEI